MKIFKGLILTAVMVLLIGLVTSCSITKKIYGISDIEVRMQVSNQSVAETFRDIDKSLSINILSAVSNEEIYDDSNLSAFYRKALPHYTFVPTVKAFAQEATMSYLQKMQFEVKPSGDFQLGIEIKTFQVRWIDRKNVECSVVLNYKLTDAAGETVIPSRTASAHINLGQTEDFGVGLGRAYATALNQVNWTVIAKCLRTADSAKEEKNAQVKGDGDTALEHTLIRWYITSAPQGADVTWRVISSTPDVANTNSNYVGTTPYETTESFDIKGMTYNNSGNIQIEVTCEKSGYLSQRKRFNLRQAIDQKEISAKFNLVKE